MAAKDVKIKLKRLEGDETITGSGSGSESALVDGDGNEIVDGSLDGNIDSDELVGQILAGRYLIQSLIGKGGMGAVYRAQNTMLNNDVAIKVLLPDRVVNAKMVLRLQKEARALIHLEHPSLVRVFDFDIDEERQQPFIVMKFEEGENLASLMKNGPVGLERALKLIIQAAEALQHAHAHGIVHRDLKPSNMIVGKDDNGQERIKILDFGIAKIDDPKSGTMGLTQTGEFFGSPQYMSPEQCKGQSVDARTDVYSLACVLHEMVTGQSAVNAQNTIEMLMQHVNGLKLNYTDKKIPTWLQQCLRHALAKDRDARYATMKDFVECLRTRTDKKNSTAAASSTPAPETQFVYDPVVQVGVTPGQAEAVERFYGFRIGVFIVAVIAFLVVWCFVV